MSMFVWVIVLESLAKIMVSLLMLNSWQEDNKLWLFLMHYTEVYCNIFQGVWEDFLLRKHQKYYGNYSDGSTWMHIADKQIWVIHLLPLWCVLSTWKWKTYLAEIFFMEENKGLQATSSCLLLLDTIFLTNSEGVDFSKAQTLPQKDKAEKLIQFWAVITKSIILALGVFSAGLIFGTKLNYI